MPKYQNPVPDIDDEEQSRTVTIPFTFPVPVTRAEAAENLNEWFRQNQLTAGNVKLTGHVGMCYKNVQPSLSRNDRDPNGYGPRGYDE